MGRSIAVRRALSAAAGVAAALLVLEGMLRLLATPQGPPAPRILADSLDLPAITRRQVEEGVAVAHFSAAGARLTGNPPSGRNATVVILGDSYVLASEVADRETMGSQLERLARANGLPIDVRQYGWHGASPAQYLVAAPAILARWHPLRVIIAVADNDLDIAEAILATPRLRVDKSGQWHVIGPAADTVTGAPLPSALMMLASHRWLTLQRNAPRWLRRPQRAVAAPTPPSTAPAGLAAPDSAEAAQFPGAVVRELAKAYGSRLAFVYMAEVNLTWGEAPSLPELRLLEACRAARVSCVSTRSDMLDARRRGIIAHGVSTSQIGHGHLNPLGHRIMANAMWRILRD